MSERKSKTLLLDVLDGEDERTQIASNVQKIVDVGVIKLAGMVIRKEHNEEHFALLLLEEL